MENRETEGVGTVDTSNHTSEKKLCVFLGAGASSYGGYRTFLTFPHMFWPTSTEPAKLNATDKERALLTSIRGELERKRKTNTLDNYLSSLNEYNIVLRSMFSDEELRKRFSDALLFLARIEEMNQVVQRARTHILELTVEHYRSLPSPRFYRNARYFYARLLEQFGLVEVFTTNYDLVPEFLFTDLPMYRAKSSNVSVTYNDHDTKITKALKDVLFQNGFAEFGGSFSNFGCWQPNNYRIPLDKKQIDVYRLHGCVAWYYKEIDDGAVEFDMSALEDIRNSFNRICVMYPSKEQMKGNEPYTSSFLKLYRTCLEASTILAIGFSFRDIDVVSVMFNAIKQRADAGKKTKLVVVDPYIDKDILIDRLNDIKHQLTIPIAINENELQIVTIRTEFPPEDPAGTSTIVNSLQM